MEDLKKCCFCGKEIEFAWFENNPEPVDNREGSVCCTDCNYKIVLPARSIIETLVNAVISGKALKKIDVPDFSKTLDIVKGVQYGEITIVNID